MKQCKKSNIIVPQSGKEMAGKKSNISDPAHRKDAHAVGGRIKYYRECKRKEQKEIAEKIGVTSNAISNWENGRTRPDFSVVPKLCEALGITLYELYGIDDKRDAYTDKEKSMIGRYRSLSHPHQIAIDRMMSSLEEAETVGSFPEIIKLVCCDKGLAAGFDTGAEFEDAGKPIYLYPNTNTVIRQADLVFPVNGDSMEPEYHDGDLVLVERYPGCSELQYGEVGAFSIGNSTYIKVYEEEGLVSLNENYDIMTFSEYDNVTLIGRVLGILEPSSIASNKDAERYEAMHEGNED